MLLDLIYSVNMCYCSNMFRLRKSNYIPLTFSIPFHFDSNFKSNLILSQHPIKIDICSIPKNSRSFQTILIHSKKFSFHSKRVSFVMSVTKKNALLSSFYPSLTFHFLLSLTFHFLLSLTFFWKKTVSFFKNH